MPIWGVMNYPQGILVEPIMFIEKFYVFLFGLVVLTLESGGGT